MKLMHWLATGLMVAGAAAGARALRRRTAREAANRHVALVADYDDAVAVALRAPLALGALLARLRAAGATHVTLPEDTLARLMAQGRLAPVAPAAPLDQPAPYGRWLYLAALEAGLAARVAEELRARVPQCAARVLAGMPPVIALAGELPVLAEIGLGFDPEIAAAARAAGLGVVPRPVAYAWADAPLIDRTLAQARAAGGQIVAFAGDLIVGHEMHLQDTVDALARHGLTFAYFALSRHQRGDWFIAKLRGNPGARLSAHDHDHSHSQNGAVGRREPDHDEHHEHAHGHYAQERHHHHEHLPIADTTPPGTPRVMLAHELTPAQMIPEDLHSAAARWALYAGEEGVRVCLLRAFRVVHATEPLEWLSYVEHTAEALRAAGFAVDGVGTAPALPPGPSRGDIALAGLVPAAAGAVAAADVLGLPESVALGLLAAGAVGALAAPALLDRPRDPLERAYPPSYAPKALALVTASAVPVASVALGPAGGAAAAAAGATALAVFTSGDDYARRVEDFRGYNLDLWLPLLAVLLRRRDRRVALGGAALVAAAWAASARAVSAYPQGGDVLACLNAGLPVGHTHHLSAFQRALGDVRLALGPRPVRKWAWLAPLGAALAASGRLPLAAGDLLQAFGVAALLVSFRQGARPLRINRRERGGRGGFLG
jgi:hypothetical protein